MRNLIIIGLLFFSISMNAQKMVRQIADDVCDCINQEEFSDSIDIKEVVEFCMQKRMHKYEKELRKYLGDDAFDSGNNEKLHLFGMQVGKMLISDCPEMMELVINSAKVKNSSASEYFEQAQALADSGDYDNAIRLYSSAIEKDPLQFDYFNYRGISYYNLGQYYKAISDFYRASEIDPENHQGLYNAAYSIYELCDNQSAMEVVNQVIDVNKYYCSSYNLKGLIYNQLNKSDSALIFYKQAYECDTTNLTFLYNMGYAHYYLREYDKAINCMKEAEERGYVTYELILYTGNCYDQLKQYDKALEYQTRLINNYEVDYVPYYNRGLVYLGKEQYEDALQDFVAAAALESTDLDIDEQMVYAYKGLKQYNKALERCNKMIQEETANANYRDIRADIYTQIGEIDLALADYKMSLSLYPDDCSVHTKIGDLYKRKGDSNLAQKHYSIAKEMGCNDEE